MTDRILVTGARGFVGSAVLDALSTAHQIHAVTSSPADDLRPAVAWHRGNLLEAGVRATLIDTIRPTHLLHLAWTTEHGTFWEDPSNLDWTVATLDLVGRFAARGGRRLVLVGSCAEYDWNQPGPYAEDSPLAPTSLYGACKMATATAALAFAERTSISLAWARLFHLYGPREHRSRLVPSLIDAAHAGCHPAPREPQNVIDLMHVEDAAGALVALLAADAAGAVNVASGAPVRLAEVADHIAHAADITATRLPMRHHEPRVISADVTRLRSEVGFVPRVDLRNGLTEATTWWRNQPDDHEAPR